MVRTLGRVLMVEVGVTDSQERQVPKQFVLKWRCKHFCYLRKCRLELFLDIHKL